jgi:signal peptidase I
MKVAAVILIFSFSIILLLSSSTYALHITCDSDSMAPTLNCHSNLTLYRYYNNTPQINDIIIYRLTNEDRFIYDFRYTYIIHRIINKTSAGYITQGDNNPAPDPWIVKPWLIGWNVSLNGTNKISYSSMR